MSKKNTSELVSAAGVFQGLVTNIMAAVREDDVPFELVRHLSGDKGRDTLRRALTLALDEYVKSYAVPLCGPTYIELEDGSGVRVLLLKPPDNFPVEASGVVAWAKNFRVKTAPYGFLPATEAHAKALAGKGTYHMYLLNPEGQEWSYDKYVFVGGKMLKSHSVAREPDVPVLLVANQIPALRDDDPCGD